MKINTPGFFSKVVGHPGDTWLDLIVGNLVRFYIRTLGYILQSDTWLDFTVEHLVRFYSRTLG